MTPSAKPQRSRRSDRDENKSDRHLRVIAPTAVIRQHQVSRRRDRIERVINVTIALVGLVVTAPVWLAIAILIKLTSRGPVFYAQTRIGINTRTTDPALPDPRRQQDLGGRPFTIHKFRTMTVEAESGSGPVWASRDDPRVTAFGRILRQLRLDELPQLINVIMGDMNIVGPRPERPSLFAELRRQIPDYPLRQRARPGITGHAQINLEYDSSVDDVRTKLRYDLEYIEKRSLITDLKIMLKTIPVILFRRGGW
jgi:lipopolysaccharide/colanic/teichoic acid biosynthesis glycosyltransferase